MCKLISFVCVLAMALASTGYAQRADASYPIDVDNVAPVLIGNWERCFDTWRIERGNALVGFTGTGATLDGPEGVWDPDGIPMALKVVGDAVGWSWSLQYKFDGPTNEDLNTHGASSIVPALFGYASAPDYEPSPWNMFEVDATVLSAEWLEDEDPLTDPFIEITLILNGGGPGGGVWYDAGNVALTLDATTHCVWDLSAGIQQVVDVWNAGGTDWMYYEIAMVPNIGGYEPTTTGTMYLDAAFLTPEPATIALLGLGGLSLLRIRRKR